MGLMSRRELLQLAGASSMALSVPHQFLAFELPGDRTVIIAFSFGV
jgi:hypothetical protein